MNSNTLLFGWNRSLPGREHLSAQHFGEFVDYLGGLVKAGTIDGFDPVFLEPHGGDMNGFFLLRGKAAKLDSLTGSEDWAKHMIRATMHLESAGYVRGHAGEAVMERMQLWTGAIPD